MVKNQLGPLHGPIDRFAVRDVALDNLDRLAQMVEVRAEPGREVVQHADAIPTFDQRGRDVRPDKPGAAGDKTRPHCCYPREQGLRRNSRALSRVSM